METTPSNSRWDYTKIKSFCIAKETISRMGEIPHQLHFKQGATSQNLQRIVEIKYQRIKEPENKGANAPNR